MFVFLFAHQTHMTYYSSTTHSKVKILKEIKVFYKYYHRLIHVSGLISPGQGASLQLCVSERSWVEQPWSQVLVLVCSPDPHGALQLDQLLHVEKSKRLVNKDHRLWAIVIRSDQYSTLNITLTSTLSSSVTGTIIWLRVGWLRIIWLWWWNCCNWIQSNIAFHCLFLTSTWWCFSVKPECSHWKTDVCSEFGLNYIQSFLE